jgi:hypothetical protein
VTQLGQSQELSFYVAIGRAVAGVQLMFVEVRVSGFNAVDGFYLYPSPEF